MDITGEQMKIDRAAYRTMTAHRPRWRRRYLGAATLVLLVASSTGAAAGSAARVSRQKSSIDDCRAIVQLGKHQFGWSSTAAPAYDFYPDLGDYVAECSWKELGVAEPRLGNQWSLAGFVITRPVYAGAFARIEIHTFKRDSASSAKPVLRDEKCILQRDGSDWSVRECSAIRSRNGPHSNPAALIHPLF